MLLGACLELFVFASVVLAPLLALLEVFLQPAHVGSRLLAWLGVSTSILLLSALPAYTVFIAEYGSQYSRYYAYVPLLGAAGALLGAFLWSYNLDRFVHGTHRSRKLGYACLLFLIAVALAPLPWLWGAQMYLGGGEFAAEYPAPAGDGYAYLCHVAPLGSALAVQAWNALRDGSERQARPKPS